jgi:uncharacterized RDD family membrane protein YckC
VTDSVDDTAESAELGADARPAAQATFRGQRLGLPPGGPGSLATVGPRLAAFALDCLASALVAGLFVRAANAPGAAGQLPGSWSLVPFALDYLVGLTLGGRTLGMYLLGLRVIRVDRSAAVDPWRALVRTVLLCALVPAVIFDHDGRGLHDRLTDTAVVRA